MWRRRGVLTRNLTEVAGHFAEWPRCVSRFGVLGELFDAQGKKARDKGHGQLIEKKKAKR